MRSSGRRAQVSSGARLTSIHDDGRCTISPWRSAPVARKARQPDDARPEVDPRLARVIAASDGEPAVAYGGGKGFGSGALKAGGKIFVFVSSNGRLVAKLPAGRVDDFVRQGLGTRFDAG